MGPKLTSKFFKEKKNWKRRDFLAKQKIRKNHEVKTLEIQAGIR